MVLVVVIFDRFKWLVTSVLIKNWWLVCVWYNCYLHSFFFSGLEFALILLCFDCLSLFYLFELFDFIVTIKTKE